MPVDDYEKFYCQLCDSVVIDCTYCGNSSCNGSSCEKCHEDFVKMNELDIDPRTTKLPIVSHITALDELFGSKTTQYTIDILTERWYDGKGQGLSLEEFIGG